MLIKNNVQNIASRLEGLSHIHRLTVLLELYRAREFII